MTTGGLRIVPLEPADVAALTDVMTRSFDDDAWRHLGVEKGGPPGYDTGEFLRTYGFDPAASAFEAVLDDAPVGAIIVFARPDGHHVLGCIFTDPDVQRRGVGAALFRHVENAFPARSWRLETPECAASNHLFYIERCGFRRVGERDDAEGGGPMVVYEKTY
jgi:ribosomal protein S18 acetylase RimI-like enzyme